MTANNASRTYGASDPAFTASYSGFVLGQTLGNSGVSEAPALVSGDNSSSPVGGYTIVAWWGALAAQNYTFVFRQRHPLGDAGRAGGHRELRRRPVHRLALPSDRRCQRAR